LHSVLCTFYIVSWLFKNWWCSNMTKNPTHRAWKWCRSWFTYSWDEMQNKSYWYRLNVLFFLVNICSEKHSSNLAAKIYLMSLQSFYQSPKMHVSLLMHKPPCLDQSSVLSQSLHGYWRGGCLSAQKKTSCDSHSSFKSVLFSLCVWNIKKETETLKSTICWAVLLRACLL